MLTGVVPLVVIGVVDVEFDPFAEATKSLRAVPLPTKRTAKPARSIAHETLLQTLDMGKDDMLEFLVVSLESDHPNFVGLEQPAEGLSS